MATNVEIQKLFISVPKDLASYFMANTTNSAVVDPKKIYFFEDGRIWTNGRTYSKSDEEFEAIFTGIDEKISAEEARAKAAEQLLTDNLAKEVADRTQAIADEAARTDEAIAAEAALREADVEALQKAIDQAVADAKSYTVAKVEGDELSNLGTTVKEAFKLVDEDGVKCGEYIKIYKDSAIKSVSYSGQKLIITYILADGTESVAEIDMAEMIIEAEHGDGLQVNEAGVVSVKCDETSEAFLSVSAEGIKVSGVQAAIDAAVAAEKAERIADVDEEQTRAEAAEAKLTADLAKEADTRGKKDDALATSINWLSIAVDKIKEDYKAADEQLQTNIDTAKTEFNAQLTSAVETLNNKVATEAQAREDAVTGEKERAEGVEAGLQSAIDAEKARAEAKEAELEGKIGSTNEGHAQDIADVRAELAAETSRAEGKEAELAGLIDAEQARAEAAEKANADAIKAEEERAIAVENTKVDWTYLGGERKAITLANHDLLLGTAKNGATYNIGMISQWDVVDLGTTSLPINLNTPAGVRPTVQEAGKSGEEAEKIAFLSDVDSANANLNAAIEAEKARAEAAEKANADAIAAEVEAARAAEEKLAQDLAKEAETRDNKDDALATSISWLSTAVGKMNDDYKAADTQLQNNIDAAKSELQQAIQDEADARIADVDAEEARALAAEAGLQGAIDAEKERAEQAEAALQGKLDQEAVNREGADIELQGAIDTEKARAEQAEADLQGKLDQEAVNREGADIELQGAIDTEKARAEQAEADLQAALDAEIKRAKEAEANNNSIAGQAVEMIIAEEARAKEAEQANAAAIATEAARATDEEGRIEDKLDAAVAKHTYSVVKLTDEELAALADSANVQEAFKLVDGDNHPAGETIKIYKDSSLKSVALEDVVVEGAQDTQNLVFTYILADGKEEVVKVDISQFVSEAEFKAGLQVIGGEVSVKIAEGSESFLSVDMNGVKLAGVQAAIDAAVADEQARAEAAEAGLNELVTGVNTKLNMKVTELNAAITAEKERAEGEEGRIEAKFDKGLEDELARATAEEGRIEAKLDEEIRRSTAADGSIVNDMAVAHANINKALADETARATGEEARIEGLLNAEVANREAAVAAEKSRAEGVEAQLTADLANEAARAKAAEEANAQAIAALETSSSNALAAAKAELEGKLADETNARIADVDAEEARAIAAEKVLTDNLAAEATTARAAEAANKAAIEAEVTRATGKEGELSDAIQNTFNQAAAGLQTLQTALNEEAAARTAADNKLTNDLVAESDRAKAQEDKIEAAIGLAADGSYATIDANYTDGATTIVEAIRAIDAAAKVNEDAIADEKAERLAADAAETQARQDKDAELLGKLQAHESAFTTKIDEGLAATKADAHLYTDDSIKAFKEAHNAETTGVATVSGKLSLAEKTRNLITVALSQVNGKVIGSDNTNDTYVDVVYSEHNAQEGKVSDGIVTGEVLVSVLDNLWETFATA